MKKSGERKRKRIAALLTQRNAEEAARLAKVGIRTLYRWQKEPKFDSAYRAARRAAFGQTVARLQQATSAAVSTLLKVMVDAGTPASIKSGRPRSKTLKCAWQN